MRRNRFLVGFVALVAACSLGLIGVASASVAADERLSKKELIKKADKICTKFNDKFVTAANKAGLTELSPTPEVDQFIVDEQVPLLRKEIKELRKLKPPRRDAKQVKAIFAEVESAVDQVEANPSLISSGVQPGPFATADQLALEYGFKVCGAEAD